MSSAYRHSDDFTKSLHHMEASSGKQNLANIINEAFIGPLNKFSPLPTDFELDMADFPSSPSHSAPSVYRKLSTLNPTKAQGLDGIPAWLLRENADISTFTVMDSLNSLYRKGRLPHSWKMANIITLPKQNPERHVNKHLRPISLTPTLSKIAEEFIVKVYVKPAALKEISANQFGCVPKSLMDQACRWKWCYRTSRPL